jgi:hypothetical protein
VFVVVYLAYWSTILSNIRYAIVPFALLTMLLGVAATHFYNRQEYKTPKLVKASILAAEIYCLLIAAMGTMYIEINPPQLKYFAHLLDKPGYLRAALRTYGSLEYLQSAAEREAPILGIANCSAVYAPDPLHFDCVFCPSAGCKLDELAHMVKGHHIRYIIASEHDVPPSMIQELNDGVPGVQMYRDDYYSVFRLGQTAAPAVK